MRFAILALCCLLVAAEEEHAHEHEKTPESKRVKNTHHFTDGAELPFYVNKIGPYSNPSERFEFYDLPFCQPKVVEHAHGSLGGDISGHHLRTSLYDIRFNVPIHWTALCKKHLVKKEIQTFKDAIDKYYYFELNLDDLPIHGFIGTIDVELKDGEEIKHYYLFKHLHFHILRNKDQVIFVNVTADPNKLEELKDEDMTLEFSYSASWEETDWPFKDRQKLYEDHFFRGLEIHWLSIMNSIVLVLLLTGFLAIIVMRILKSDYSRYARAGDEEIEDDAEDYGWKLIHGEVFRFPPYKSLFTAFIGLGSQCLAILTGVMILAVTGVYAPNNNGAMFTSIIVLYAVTCGVAGFVSASYYRQFEGDKWSWNLILVASLMTGPFLVIFAFVNTLATIYHATAAVPAGTIIMIIIILVVIGFPLTLIGGIAGKRTAGDFKAPCRTKNFAREIPPIAIYRSLPAQMIMSGFLPFSAIYIELFYIYSSVWGHSTYQLFGILSIVFAILLVVTACITVALTYFQLSMEDYRWWWNSFLTGGSTGIFIYAYSIFYYVWRSNMSGMLQGSFYFAYMFIVCYFFFVMLGTVGFLSSLLFVKRIYINLKCD